MALPSSQLPSISEIPDGDQLRGHYREATVAGLLLTIPLAAGLAVWGDVLVSLLFGDRYVSPRMTYPLLAAGVAVHALAGPNGLTLIARHRHRAIAYLSITLVALDATLNALFIPQWGEPGAALATLLAYVFVNVGMSLLARRHVGGHFGASNWIGIGILLTTVCGGVLFFARFVLGDSIGSLALAATAAGVVYLATIWTIPTTRIVLEELFSPWSRGQRTAH